MKRLIVLSLTSFLWACSGDDSNSGSRSQETTSAPPITIELDSGTVVGKVHSESDVLEWLGIPYAQPPIGNLRWKAPQPVAAWDGSINTQAAGNVCPQRAGGVVIGDEDCLHLNIWRPNTDETDLPVYVWVHPGANTIGTNYSFIAEGDRIAQNSNVIVVAMSYRLGALGWLYFEPLHTGDALSDSGNFGLLDIIQGLDWVQNNIASFGGDVDNVIVTGESAGAANIMSLLLSDQASGLFHKAIIQSGSPVVKSLDEARAQSRQLLENLDSTQLTLSDQEQAQFLMNTSASDLVLAQSVKLLRAFADGTVIPIAGTTLFETGMYPNKVPIIVGSTKDEFDFYVSPLVLNSLPDHSQEVRNDVSRYVSDFWRAYGVDNFATELSSAPDQPDIYAYRFNWGSKNEDGQSPYPDFAKDVLGAHHVLDVSFVFGYWDRWFTEGGTDYFFTEENAEGRENLSNAITAYFAAFAHTGNPNVANQTSWEPFSVDGDFKALMLDVDLNDNSAKLTVDSETYTSEGLLEKLTAEVEDPALSIVLDEILRWQD